jgi:hypothetical protein
MIGAAAGIGIIHVKEEVRTGQRKRRRNHFEASTGVKFPNQ